MKLSDFLAGLMLLEVQGDPHKSVTHVESPQTYDFVLRGPLPKDNHVLFVHLGPLLADDLTRYFRNNVHMLVVDRAIIPPAGVTVLRVVNTAHAFAHVSNVLAENPSRFLTVIGVTGTTGKTTTTHLMDSILRTAGCRTALFGTLGHRLDQDLVMGPRDPEHLTTPTATQLQDLMRKALERKITHVVMEVSSMGLAEHRVSACQFDAAVFTNISPEHMELHLTFADYMARKFSLFTQVLRESEKANRWACVNVSDPRGKKLFKIIPKGIERLGFARRSGTSQQVYFRRAKVSPDGLQAEIASPAGLINVQSKLIGSFHLMNILAATSACVALSVDRRAIEEGIARLENVTGRLQRVPNKLGVHAYFDWAHTVEGYRRVLMLLRQWKKGGRLYAIFGCEDRMDARKRAVTAGIAAKYADELFISLESLDAQAQRVVMEQMSAGMAPFQTPRTFCQTGIEALASCLQRIKPGDTAVVIGWELETLQDAHAWLEQWAKDHPAQVHEAAS